MYFNEYAAQDGLGLAGLISNDEISSGAVQLSILAPVKRFNPTLSTVIETIPVAGLKQSLRSVSEGIILLLRTFYRPIQYERAIRHLPYWAALA